MDQEMYTQAPLRQLESRMHYESHLPFLAFSNRSSMYTVCVLCCFYVSLVFFISLMDDSSPVQVSEMTNSALCSLIPLFCSHRDTFWFWRSKLVRSEKWKFTVRVEGEKKSGLRCVCLGILHFRDKQNVWIAPIPEWLLELNTVVKVAVSSLHVGDLILCWFPCYQEHL